MVVNRRTKKGEPMNLQEQIRRILAEFFQSEEFSTDQATSEIEKLVYSACQKQKEICAEAEIKHYTDNGRMANDPLPEILNAPLPAETERCYSGKEVEELVKVLENYNQLLSDECSSLVGMAAVHGWKSDRFEAGVKCREEISNLKKEYGIKI
jgi:hypothetical protein